MASSSSSFGSSSALDDSTSDEDDDVKRLTKFASSYYDKQKSGLLFVKNHSSSNNNQEEDKRSTPDTTSPPSSCYKNVPIQIFVETPIFTSNNDPEIIGSNSKFCIRSNSVYKHWKFEMGGTSNHHHHPPSMKLTSSQSDHHHHASTHLFAEYRILPDPDDENKHTNNNNSNNGSIKAGIVVPSFYYTNKPYVFVSSHYQFSFLNFLSPKLNITNNFHLLLPSQPTHVPSLGTNLSISSSSWDQNYLPTLSNNSKSHHGTTTATQFQARFRLFGGVSPFPYNEEEVYDTDTMEHHPILLSISNRQFFPWFSSSSSSSSDSNGCDTIVSLACGFLGDCLEQQPKNHSWLFPSCNFNLDIRPRTLPHQLKLSIVASITKLQWITQYSRLGGGLVIRIPITLQCLAADATTNTTTTTLLYIIQTAYVTLLTTILHDILVDYFYTSADTKQLGEDKSVPFDNHKRKEKTKEEATRQIILLTKSSIANRKMEESKSSGLVIVEAFYYYTAQERHDVTIPLQFWVSESVLKLPSGSKASMLGFYDIASCSKSSHEVNVKEEETIAPSSLFARCIQTCKSIVVRFKGENVSQQQTQENNVSAKTSVKLFVRYKHGGIEDKITINDDEELYIP